MTPAEKFEYLYSGGFEKTATAQDDDAALGRLAFKQYDLIKTANSFSSGATSIYNALKAMAPAAAIGAGIFGAGKALSAIQERRMKQDMLKSYDYVKKNIDQQDVNPQLVHDAFSTLQLFAPSIASKPLAAKTFVQLVTNRGGIDPELLKQITGIQKDYTDANKSSSGFGDILSGIGTAAGTAKTFRGN
jgi:hypothetical protein